MTNYKILMYELLIDSKEVLIQSGNCQVIFIYYLSIFFLQCTVPTKN